MSPGPTLASSRRRCSTWISDAAAETISAGVSSFVTMEYTHEVDPSRLAAVCCPRPPRDVHTKMVADTEQQLSQQAPSRLARAARQPSPELLLVACLVLGCSVSSFLHRRQAEDQYQLLVFILCIACAVFLAWGGPADVILLRYIPWAMCAAMAISYYGHSLVSCSC